jgi:hypothetical protein
VKEIVQSFMFDQIPVSFIVQYALDLSPLFIQEGVPGVFGMELVYLLRYLYTVYGGYRNIDNQLECLQFTSDYEALKRDSCPNLQFWIGLFELKSVISKMFINCDTKKIGNT